MVSNKHRFIFVHIIKTGGTSIEDFFGGRKIHKYAINYKKEIPSNKWKNYFKFTFVRNPWDKMVSQYFYIKKNCREKYVPLSFKDFILAFDHCGESEYIQKKGVRITYNPIQLPWIMDNLGYPLVDFIGRFETLQKDFDKICEKLKIQKHILPHENKSDHKHYSKYYDQETKEIIARKFKRDIEYFNYDF